ncbi:MAG: hypothetical protein A2Y17_09280 [Clostridiales bacterium GWF2_38_85]|nr:MAG: hypothetical protein A2Y17_09280 [Clostridiales bacterium GWF2_38_85]HBL83610.1 hypothetical protein [Clostridiales bacterium]
MKLKFKALISLFLALFMLLSMCSFLTVFAAETSSDESLSEEEQKLDEAPYTKIIYGSVQAKVNTMTQGITVGDMTMFYDPASGEVAIKNDVTGEYLLTNPYNVSSTTTSTGTASSPATLQTLLSQVIVKYTENDKESTFNSFKDAAIEKQIVVKDIRGGLRVEYTLGREEVRLLVPECITVEDFNWIYEPIASQSKYDADKFAAYYLLKDANNPNDPKKTQLTTKIQWPITEKFPVYVLDPSAKYAERLRLEKIVKKYTALTFELLDEMHIKTDYTVTNKEPALFKLALEYYLEEDGVSVRLAANNIRFDSSNYKLEDITYLPYMGSAVVANSAAANKGYVFTPDGSGSLISFEDVVGQPVIITDSLYGHDYAFHDISSGANKEVMRLPVFGIIQEIAKWTRETVPIEEINDKGEIVITEKPVETYTPYNAGYLAIIEEGASLSQISVENGGITHNRISVFTKFNPRPKDQYKLDGGLSAGSNAMWTVESKRKYTGDFRIRYIMLKDDDATYAGMARTYQNYLVEKGVLTSLDDTEDDIPLYIETLGALDTTARILGVPVDKQTALSSFSKTIEFLEALKKQDISNVKVKLTGWINGGLTSTVPYKFNIEKALGDDKGFANLVEYAKQNNIELFPDFDFVFVKTDKAFDGFNYKDSAVLTIDDRAAQYRKYNYVYQTYRSGRWVLLSPNVTEAFYDKIYEKYSTFNVGGIGISTLGSVLTSDFNEDAQLNREDSVVLYTRLLAKILEENGKVLISGGNSFTLQYATDILDVPFENSRSIYSYASVPFMGMVLHSYVDFSGTAINLAGDYRYALLKTIENGASPYFIIALENASELITSDYSEYYSVRASIWLQSIIDTYDELNTALKDVQTQKMVDHQFVGGNQRIIMTKYENGVVFYLNYTLDDYTVEIFDEDGEVTDSFIVPSQDFIKFDKNGKQVN